jgi:hypothetical protein
MMAQWLDQLAAAHAPAAPGWWPPAPGWWVVAALSVAIMAIGAVWFYGRRDPHRIPRRRALRELQRLREHCEDAMVAGRLQNLLRRFALQVFGRAATARLSGDAWLAFVLVHGGTSLTQAAGRSFLVAVYGEKSSADQALWFEAVEAFVRRAGRRRTSRTQGAGTLLGTQSTARPGS